MPSFEQEHFFLLEFSNILEPKSSYRLDYTYTSIYSLLEQVTWDPVLDGPTPKKEVNCMPESWYTQYWDNCATNHVCADLDGYEFREICDYTFEDDETIFTGHFLDQY